MLIFFKKYVFLVTVTLLLILTVGAAYYRFVILHDYIVSFETDCDPQSEICFVGCEDDECLVEYPYAVITRHAAHLYQQCGPDVTDCEHAFSCEGDTSCSISYCNTATENDTCFTATETSKSKP